MSNSSDAPRSVWRRIPASSQPLTNPKPGKWESAGYRFQSHDTKSPARKQRQKQRWFKGASRSGAQAVKAVSVFSNAAMGCGDRSTKDRTASSAGSDSG